MTDRPKLQTVAKEAGVSIATVSQVLRGSGRISEETRKKVLNAARKVNYVPDGRAASMRSGQVKEIGLVIQQIANPFNAEVISGASDQLEAEGYLLSVLDSRDDPDKQRRNLEALIRSTRGGLLWVPAIDTPPATLDLLKTHRIPTVTFLRRLKGAAFDHVGIENAQATYQATGYLADLGHRHIAFLGGTADVDSRNERIAGFRRAMADRHLAEPVVWPCVDSKLAGMDALIALRAAHPEVTGIICNGDMVALGACLAMFRIGLHPGRDISVIGFDDVQDAAIATPPLTTLAVAPYDLGRRLAKVLLDRIRDPAMPQITATVPAQLIVRGTTGPVPAG